MAILHFGELTIDRRARRVLVNGSAVSLTHSEFTLLDMLTVQPGAAVSNRDLMAAVWGPNQLVDTGSLQVHISRLRRKLRDAGSTSHHIATVNGYGYRFDPEAVQGHDERAAQSVTLTFDGDLVLRDIDPRMMFCGWHPDVIIGRFYSPAGLDEDTARNLVNGMIAMGALEVNGTVDVRRPDGSLVQGRAETRIDVDGGRFMGLRTTLHLQDRVAPGFQIDGAAT